MNTIWKLAHTSLAGYKYYVSSDGLVKSVSPKGKEKSLKTWYLPSGYECVSLGKGTRKYVHRLVLEAFRGECPLGQEACHNNGINSDNRLDNLRWDTHTNNNLDKRNHGTVPDRTSSKLTREEIIEIRGKANGTWGENVTLAKEYDVDPSTISVIKNNKTWQNLEASSITFLNRV